MKKRNIRNLLLYIFCVLGPIAGILYSTAHAFHSSLIVIGIMMAISAGVSGVCTYSAGDAVEKVRVYCTQLNLVLGIIGCLNLCGHLAMSRQLSAAEDSVVELRQEQDREDERAKAAAEREIAQSRAAAEKIKADAMRLQAQTSMLEADRRRLAQLPVERRRLAMIAGSGAETQTTPESIQDLPGAATSSAKAKEPVKTMTPQEVRDAWSWWFIAFSFLEAGCSIVGGLGAKMKWAWDRNHNGIDDALEVQFAQLNTELPSAYVAPHVPSSPSRLPNSSRRSR